MRPTKQDEKKCSVRKKTTVFILRNEKSIEIKRTLQQNCWKKRGETQKRAIRQIIKVKKNRTVFCLVEDFNELLGVGHDGSTFFYDHLDLD